ncbi:hypothetical protein SteCoe_22832 [Stentor coeruleus]|uniref:Cilia- and flagella-associated protein 36 n=1 Tax=Stentor coeruleus TaxID=5963 RepID=A0A1R2BLA5_9CILI|nr:hypothetical protein SteCoe_22832 [Stentor coeruleus]
MIENLLENLLKELNVSSELFIHIVEIGMKNQDDKKVFEQIIACDSFMSFKKLMTKRNKEIEVEVVKSMKKEGIATEEDLELALEKQEIAEVGYALALSIAWEEEQRRKAREAEEELQKAIRESEIEYKAKIDRERADEEIRRRKKEEEDRLEKERLRREEEERRRKQEEDERLAREKRERDEAERLRMLKEQELRELEEKRRREEKERRDREEAERKKREQEELERVMEETRRLQKQREEDERKRQEEMRLRMEEMRLQREREMEEVRKRAEAEAERLRLELEAISGAAQERSAKPRVSLIPMQAMQLDVNVLDLNKGHTDLTKELQEAENLRRMTQNIMKRQGEGGRRETVAEREEKLLKQREMLLTKKKIEREQMLKDFKDSGGIDFSQEPADNAKETGGFPRKRNSILDAKRNSYRNRENLS